MKSLDQGLISHPLRRDTCHLRPQVIAGATKPSSVLPLFPCMETRTNLFLVREDLYVEISL